MAWNTLQTGSLTQNYTAATAAALGLQAGMQMKDEAAGKAYIFLKNAGAASIAASEIAVVTTTDASSFQCRQGTGTSSTEVFAGCRVVGASSVAQNEFGWFQVNGTATLNCDATGTTASLNVIPSATVAGKVLVGNTSYSFGQAESTSTGTAVVHLNKNAWGIGI